VTILNADWPYQVSCVFILVTKPNFTGQATMTND
jgi:hypothetical protein